MLRQLKQTDAALASYDRALAIKPDLAEAGDFVKRFEREAETIASLSHPHILKLFDYGEHSNTVYLVMELLTGGSLADVILVSPLKLDTSTLKPPAPTQV